MSTGSIFSSTGGYPGTDYEAKVLGQAERAIDLAPDNVRAYYVKGELSKPDSAAPAKVSPAAEAGLAINPNFVLLLAQRSSSLKTYSVDPSKRRPTFSSRCG